MKKIKSPLLSQKQKLFSVEKTAMYLGVNEGTVLKWAKKGMLKGITVGPSTEWQFKEIDLEKLIAIPILKKINIRKKSRFAIIKKLLIANANQIQKISTSYHAKLIGANPIPRPQFKKYTKSHIKIVKMFAQHLNDVKRGVPAFVKIGEELARAAVEDGLSIEEAVDGTIFLKQAIWKKLESEGVLNDITKEELHDFGQILGSYCDVIASTTAFTYHNHFAEKFLNSENLFRILIEKSKDAIALVNEKGKVLYASPSTEELMGYTPEEFKKLKNPFKLVPPDDRKLVTKIFEKLLHNPGTTELATYRVLHKNGNHIWIESIMTNLIKDPKIKAVVLNYRDISARKQLEEQKDDFISIAAHELRTPVTSIKAYAQVLENRFSKEGNSDAEIMLHKMVFQLNKVGNLIHDFLDITRVDLGKLQYHDELFDLSILTMEIVEEMQLTTTKQRIAYKEGPKNMIKGDQDRIGQVIKNMLSNAIKYSPDSEVVIVTTSRNTKEAILCVADFGIGVPEEMHDKVFLRFFRAGDAEDTFAGLGLGLYISAEIVKRHGGRMWVKNNKEKGSVFCFAIPILLTPYP